MSYNNFVNTEIPPSGVVSKKFKILENILIRKPFASTSTSNVNVGDLKPSFPSSPITEADFVKALDEVCEENFSNEEIIPRKKSRVERISISSTESVPLEISSTADLEIEEPCAQKFINSDDDDDETPNIEDIPDCPILADWVQNMDLITGVAETANYTLPCNKNKADNNDRLLGGTPIPLDSNRRTFVSVGLEPNPIPRVVVRLVGSVIKKTYIDILEYSRLVNYLKKIELKVKCSDEDMGKVYSLVWIDLSILPREQMKCRFKDNFIVLNKIQINNLIRLEYLVNKTLINYILKFENFDYVYKKFLQNIVIFSICNKLEIKSSLYEYLFFNNLDCKEIFIEYYTYYFNKLIKDLESVYTFTLKEKKYII